MQKKTNKGKILGFLLTSRKTTADLAYKLGYVDSEGIARYNIIHKDLKKLEEEGYIKSERVKEKKRVGNIPTLYSIDFNIENLRRMLEEYPGLTLKMQRNELVLETIFREHSDLIYNSTKEEYVEQIEKIKSHIKVNKESLEEKLKLSTEFFKIFLMNDEERMKNRIRSIVRMSNEEVYAMHFIINDNPDSFVRINETIFGIDMAFKACVSLDILNGRFNRKAEEYVKQMKNEVSDEQIEILRHYYKNTEVAPEFLRGKKLVTIQNNKLQEIEHEFLDKGGKFVNYDAL